MILVDTSIWIQLFKKSFKRNQLTVSLEEFVICPPIIQEILQGTSLNTQEIELNLLAFNRVADPVLMEDYLNAAHLYRLGRKKGYTIRSSMDCLIAAIAIKNNLPIWHHDRDFKMISNYSALEIFEPSQMLI